MTTYSALLFVHIGAAILWVGGATIMQLLGLRARAAGDERLREFVKDVAWIGKVVMGPSSLLVVSSGIWMVATGPWTLDQDWIAIGLGLFALAFVTGAAFLGPESMRIANAELSSRELCARAERLTLVARIDTALLFLIVFDMSAKPTFADPTPLVVAAVTFLAASAAIVWRSRTPAERRPCATLVPATD